jgi:hypothetical protein
MLGEPDFCPLPKPPISRFARHRQSAENLAAAEVCLVSASGVYVPVFTPPSPHEIEALSLSAAYLRRAGNEAATRLLASSGATYGKIDLIATLRDEMRDSAALCECLIAVFDDWGIPGRTSHSG